MDKLVFVSNADLSNRKGGFDGLGGKIFDILMEEWPQMRLVDKVNPPVGAFSLNLSRALRFLRLPAPYPTFSTRRLDKIAGILSQELSSETVTVFHGITPWVGFIPKGSYFCFTDCSFHTYMDVYHNKSLYSKRDLKRVDDAERQFMMNAAAVFFTSEWALDQTRKSYGLEGRNFVNIGQGPSYDIDEDLDQALIPKKRFLFIGTDFLGKGGMQIFRSFCRVRETVPDQELVIVGQKPPEEVLSAPGVVYRGYLNKSEPAGKAELARLYKESKALVLFSSRDIAPLVVIEAGLHGCPSIANASTAIPQMIRDGETGYLVDMNEQSLFAAMLDVATARADEQLCMRRRVLDFMEENFSWRVISDKIIGTIRTSWNDRR